MKLEKLKLERFHSREKLSQRVLICLGVLALFFLLARVVIANRLVEAGARLRDLDHQIEVSSDQNDLLAEEIRSRESLTKLEKKANTLGFQPVRSLGYITSPLPVAKIPDASTIR